VPIYQQAKGGGIFSSSDLALLGREFDKLKNEHQSPERREALASRLLANYLPGIRDEAELLSVFQTAARALDHLNANQNSAEPASSIRRIHSFLPVPRGLRDRSLSSRRPGRFCDRNLVASDHFAFHDLHH
jgi:hypothetical protein